MARELSDVLQVTVTEDGGVSPGVCGLGYSLPPPSVPTLLLSPRTASSSPFFSHPHSQDVGVRVAAWVVLMIVISIIPSIVLCRTRIPVSSSIPNGSLSSRIRSGRVPPS